MERKIVRVGNSLGIVIPSIFIEELGFAYGDKLDVEYNRELKTLIIKSKETIQDDSYLEQVVRRIVSECLKERGL